jgi:hypothetical protein
MKAGRTREQALAFHGDHGPRCLAELLDTDGTGRVGDLGPLLCQAVLVADIRRGDLAVVEVLKSAARETTRAAEVAAPITA